MIIIPSRMASQRLPRKPLHLISGVSLIERVATRAMASGIETVVATDDVSIAEHVAEFGGRAIMTSPELPSGTDRVAAALDELERTSGTRYDFAINLQGDEPLMTPEVISHVARAMEDESVQVATPVSKIESVAELRDPNVVKVVRSANGDALYFSRSAIPHVRGDSAEPNPLWLALCTFYKHIGLYAYRPEALRAFVKLGESMLERAERLEQLRLREAGISIRTVEVAFDSIAVDTIEDVARVEQALAQRGEA